MDRESKVQLYKVQQRKQTTLMKTPKGLIVSSLSFCFILTRIA